MEEFWRLAFEGVADELEGPTDQEQRERIDPQTVEKNAGDEDRERKQNGGNAQSVAQPVYRMLVTGSVLRDPLLVGASA